MADRLIDTTFRPNDDQEPQREPCPRCSSCQFAIYYDPLAQARHIECDDCGEVFHLA